MRKPKNIKEAALRERFVNAHLESHSGQEYRAIRRQIKKEMKELDRKENKKITREETENFLSEKS